MKTVWICASAAAILAAGPGWGAGGSPDPAPQMPADPVIEKTRAAIEKRQWKEAQDIVREGLAKSPANADYHNLYAYSIRKGANPAMDLVFRHYNEALRLDPGHRAAHEYLGEAYLMVGNPAKAKEHLQALDRLCFFACEEYSMLKKAIADYDARQASR